jgi:hypothetical protein
VNTDQQRVLGRGIAVLTAWAAQTNGDDELLWSEIFANVEGGVQDEVEMTLGLASLAGILLTMHSVASGKSSQEILQDIAHRYLL